MTLLSTRFNRAENWSQRAPIAREIFAEVRAEASQLQAEAQANPLLGNAGISDVDQLSFEELEALTRPEVAQ